MTSFVCPYCPDDYEAPSAELLWTHIRTVHANDPDFSIQCSLNGCERTFTNWRTFCNHRRRQHRYADNVFTTTDDGEEYSGTSPDPNSLAVSQLRPSVSVNDMQSFAAKWILRTRETKMLTRSAMEGVLEDLHDLVGFIMKHLKIEAVETLTKHGVSESAISSIEAVFTGPLTDPFKGLLTYHQQLSYYRNVFNFVVSIKFSYIIPIILLYVLPVGSTAYCFKTKTRVET